MIDTAPNPAALAHLAAWHAERPGFALLGEFSAGKSTLLNYLLGEALLPTQVTATELPPIWITYGAERSQAILDREGSLRPAGADLLSAGGANGALLVRVTHPAPVLRQADIIDTPGISDPRMARDALDFLMPFLDFAIWCSPAGQAWRQTEKAMWTSVPKSLQAHSILALTRVDKLRSPTDRARVLTRVKRETEGLFGSVLSLDTPAAIAATGDEATRESGADAFQAALNASLALAQALCATRSAADSPGPPSTTSAAESSAVERPAHLGNEPSPVCGPEMEADTDMSDADAAMIESMVAKMSAARVEREAAAAASDILHEDVDALAAVLNLQTSDGNIAEIRHIINDLGALRELSPEHRAVLRTVLSTTGSDDADPAKALLQVRTDLAEFASGPWRRLTERTDPSISVP